FSIAVGGTSGKSTVTGMIAWILHEGSERIVALIKAAGGHAEYFAAREDCGARIAGLARGGDRIVVMGARDDTLTEFAQSILARLP
ncbi:MAG: hypothetical protein ACK554_02695, partial [Erythrobacteraceae bacterium]